ncbi:MAG: zinc ribbon domain-containing protein [Lachnospiraceae bacterium]|nr:zinc ribbon domain-containing protein [Lachnospiraceae bacterium]
MICPSCGSDCPDGSALCPNCGADLMDSGNVQPTYNVNDALFNGGGSASTPAAPPKKKNGAMGAIIAVIAIVAIVAVVLLFGGVKYMGTYKFDSMVYTLAGEEYVVSASDIGATGDDYKLTIGLFGRSTLTSDGQKGNYQVKFNGNDVTIKASDGEIAAKYDSSAKTISFSLTELMKYADSNAFSADDLALLSMFDDIQIILKK